MERLVSTVARLQLAVVAALVPMLPATLASPPSVFRKRNLTYRLSFFPFSPHHLLHSFVLPFFVSALSGSSRGWRASVLSIKTPEGCGGAAAAGRSSIGSQPVARSVRPAVKARPVLLLCSHTTHGVPVWLGLLGYLLARTKRRERGCVRRKRRSRHPPRQ